MNQNHLDISLRIHRPEATPATTRGQGLGKLETGWVKLHVADVPTEL